MKFILFVLFGSLVAVAEQPQVFKGEIADSACAYNVHSGSRSHAEMLKSKNWASTPAECVRKCVQQFGASYVLLHGDEVYKLDRQDLAEKFAGEEVRLSGSLDQKTKVIQVQSIEAWK